MGRGEEICDGNCVNTLQHHDHCGKCFNVCDGQNGKGNYCDQGECIIVVMPYGAPMPEPLWV
jgi:hypothetical protein